MWIAFLVLGGLAYYVYWLYRRPGGPVLAKPESHNVTILNKAASLPAVSRETIYAFAFDLKRCHDVIHQLEHETGCLCDECRSDHK